MVTAETIPLPRRGLDFSESEYGLSADKARMFLNVRTTSGYLAPRGGVEAVSWVNSSIAEAENFTDGQAPVTFVPFVSDSRDKSSLAVMTRDASDTFRMTPVIHGSSSDFSFTQFGYGISSDAEKLGVANFKGRVIVPSPATTAVRYFERSGTANGDVISTFTGGPASTDIAGAFVFKSRTYFWERESASFYYTATGTVPAATISVTEFDTSEVSLTGSKIIALTSLSVDSGNGPDDLFVILLESNECLVYQGSDPGSASDWAIVGRFRSPTPNYSGGFMTFGPDIIVATYDGLFSLRGTMEAGFPVEPDWARPINPLLRRMRERFGSDGVLRPVFCPNNQMVFLVSTSGTSLSEKHRALCYQYDIKSSCWSQISFHREDGLVPDEGAQLRRDERDLGLEEVGSSKMAAVQDIIEYFGEIYVAVWSNDAIVDIGAITDRVGKYVPNGPPDDFLAHDGLKIYSVAESGEIPLPPEFSPSSVFVNHKKLEYSGERTDTISGFRFYLATDGKDMQEMINSQASSEGNAIPQDRRGIAHQGKFFKYRIEMETEGPQPDPGDWYLRDAVRLYDIEIQGQQVGPL